MVIGLISVVMMAPQETLGDDIPVINASGSPVSYIVSQSQNMTVALNGSTGDIDFSSENSTWVIQESLNAGSGIVHLNPGRYTIDVPLRLYSNDILEGSGPDAILVAKNGLDNDIIQNQHRYSKIDQNITVRDIALDGNRLNQTYGSGIFMRSVSNVLIDHIYIYDMYYFGVFVSRAEVVPGYVQQSDGVIISNVMVNRTGWDNIAVTSDHVIVENCITGVAGLLNDTKHSAGITFEDSRYSIASNNMVKEFTSYGIIVLNSIGIQLNGNSITAGKISPGSDDRAGIEIMEGTEPSLDSSDIIVSGNYIDMNGNPGKIHGIHLYWSLSKVTISGNVIKNAGQSAILMSFYASDIVITGNIITDDQMNRTQKYCFELLNGVSNILIQGNNLERGWTVSCLLNMNVTGLRMINNFGYLTYNSGYVTTSNGTSVTFDTMLDEAPNSIQITPTQSEQGSYWISEVNGTRVTISFSNESTGTPWGFYWTAEKKYD